MGGGGGQHRGLNLRRSVSRDASPPPFEIPVEATSGGTDAKLPETNLDYFSEFFLLLLARRLQKNKPS